MKILVIQQKMIGDVLTSSILFELLRTRYPEAQLDFLINEHTFPVVQHNPFIDNCVFFTENAENSWVSLFNLAQSLKKSKYDTVIDVYSKFSSNVISLFSGAKTKISKYKWYTSFIYTKTIKQETIPKTSAGLAIENRIRLLDPILREKTTIVKPKIFLTTNEVKTSKKILLNHKLDFKRPIFMLGILGSGKIKTYPLDYMAKIVDFIVKKTEAQILFNYIPSQKDDAKKIYDLCKFETQKHVFFNVYGKNLRDFLAITKHCDALIGNEGGAINMAKALNKPTFAIFSPWILKEAWNMFEDGKTNISIHLKDAKPELFTSKNFKDIKKDSSTYYQEFTPELIIPKLGIFLKNL